MMKNRNIAILLGLLGFFFCAVTASAQVVFTEVRIAPIEERFIELHNTSDIDIDLTDWYVQRKTATGSSFGSLVTKTDFENKTISAGGYFLISRSATMNPDLVKDNLTLTESNTLRLRNADGEDLDEVVWASMGESESYQKTSSGEWVLSSPTPGAPYEEAQSSDNNGNTSGATGAQTDAGGAEQEDAPPQSTQSQTTGSVSAWPVETQMFARIKNPPKIAIVGADIELRGEAIGLKKEPLEGARYLWTFGDGGNKEGESVLYHYNYPGKYVVILNASSGKYSASDRVIIEAIPADIVISSVGTGNDSFIEVHNKTKYELDLSQWKLQAGTRMFTIPENTIILSGSKIMFSYERTGLDIEKGYIVSLLYPNGALAYTYSWTPAPAPTLAKVTAPVAPVEKPKPTPAPAKKPAPVAPVPTSPALSSPAQEEKELSEELTPDDAQSASVFTAVDKLGDNGVFMWLLGVVALALVAIAGVLFARPEQFAPRATPGGSEADEYEIEEE